MEFSEETMCVCGGVPDMKHGALCILGKHILLSQVPGLDAKIFFFR